MGFFDMKEMLCLSEACKYVGVSEREIENQRKKGNLKFIQTSRQKRFFHLSDLDRIKSELNPIINCNLHPIDGFEGYFIGDDLNIYSTRDNDLRYRIKKLKQNRTNGYLSVTLCKEGNIKKPMGVHTIIAKMFIPNIENKPFVNHINNIRNDNRIENLEWVTHRENIMHARGIKHWDNGRPFLNKKGILHPLSKKLKAINIKEGTEYIFYGAKEAGRALNISQGCISRVCLGQRKTTNGYKFMYL